MLPPSITCVRMHVQAKVAQLDDPASPDVVSQPINAHWPDTIMSRRLQAAITAVHQEREKEVRDHLTSTSGKVLLEVDSHGAIFSGAC